MRANTVNPPRGFQLSAGYHALSDEERTKFQRIALAGKAVQKQTGERHTLGQKPSQLKRRRVLPKRAQVLHAEGSASGIPIWAQRGPVLVVPGSPPQFSEHDFFRRLKVMITGSPNLAPRNTSMHY